MRMTFYVPGAVFLCAAMSCSPHEEGPTPIPQLADPQVVCNDQLETWVELTGFGFSPTVVDAYGEGQGVALPEVSITRALDVDGQAVESEPLVLNPDPADGDNTRVSWTSQRKLSFLVDSSLELEQGLYDAAVENPTGDVGELPRAFAVVPPPVLTSAVPTPVCTAQYENEITLSGQWFLVIGDNLPTVTIDGRAFTPSSTEDCQEVASPNNNVQRCNTLVVTVGVDEVGVGDHDVVVTNPQPAHCQSTEAVKLRVLPPPVIDDIAPQPICVSQSDRTLTITGSDFLILDGTSPTVSIGDAAATVTNVSGCEAVSGLEDAQTCTAIEVTLATGALTPGVHDVVVTNPQTAECRSEEEVTLTVVPPPTLEAVEPQPVCNAQGDVVLTLTGTGFLTIGASLPQVSIGAYEAENVTAGGDCSEVEGVTDVTSCTELTVTVPAGTLDPGVYDVTVANPAPAGCETTETVTLTVVPPPVISDVSPNPICLDQGPGTVTITGTGFLVIDDALPTVTLGGEIAQNVSVTESSCVTVEGVPGVTSCTEVVVELAQGELEPESSPYALVVTNPAPAGCASTEAVDLVVVHAPQVDSVLPGQVCTGGGVFTVTGSYLAGVSAYLEDTDGGRVDPSSVTVSEDGTTAQIAFSAGLRPDTYDLHVIGVGGCSEVLTAAVTVVLGPVAYYMDPPVVYNQVAIRATIYASGLTGVPGTVSVAPAGGGDETALTDVSWSAEKPGQLLATIPAGLEAGVYDVFLKELGSCDALLPEGLTVVDSATMALLDPALEPAFGEQSTPVAVDVRAKADADLTGDEVNFAATPRVYLSSATLGTAQPLRAVLYESSSLLKAVVPELPEGSYDLIVVNPSGAVGFQQDAYRATAVAPPAIDDVQPSKIESASGQAVTITGESFVSPAVTITCSDGSTPGVAIDSATATELSVTVDGSGVGSGAACAVRVDNTDDQTWDEWSALSVTNPSGNLGEFTWGSDTIEARRAPGVAVGRATRKARFLYVVGGDGGDPSTAKATVEAASLGKYGDVGTFRTLQTSLPEGRTLAQARVLGDFLYLIGGADGLDVPTDEILAAEVLDPLDAPEVDDVTLAFAGSGDGLEAGAWTYAVAAVFAAGDGRNPGGESLPSEPVTLYAPNVPDGVEITLSWPTLYGADGATPAASYRVYRTVSVNGASGDLALIEEISAVAGETQSFTDRNPAAFEDQTKRPLQIGALGQWRVVERLSTPRASFGFVEAYQPGCDRFWYVFGGRTDVSTETGTYEVLDMTSGSLDAVNEFTAAGTISGRRELSLWTADPQNSLATGLGACEHYLYVGPGVSGDAASPSAEATVRVAKYSGGAGGELGVFAQAMGAPAPVNYAGYAAFLSGGVAYAMGGSRGGGAATATVTDAELSTGATLQNWNDSGVSMKTARYLMGFTRVGAFNYLVGGLGAAGEAIASTELNVR